MLPLSLAHRLVAVHGPAVDAWRALHPDSSVGSALDEVERRRGVPVPTARDNVLENGATCDGVLNTWRWSKEDYRALKKGRDVVVEMDAEDRGRSGWTTSSSGARSRDGTSARQRSG
jgi:sphingomyelin phosphodiesterase 2